LRAFDEKEEAADGAVWYDIAVFIRRSFRRWRWGFAGARIHIVVQEHFTPTPAIALRSAAKIGWGD
jgi:hypothetical protein